MVGTLLSTNLAAGADLKVVQDQLGHSTITLTADTYTSVLPETAAAGGKSLRRSGGRALASAAWRRVRR
jgi:integrase